MTGSDPLLPAPFADLERFAHPWAALATTDARYEARSMAPIEDLRAFYAAVAPRIEEIFDHLDHIPYAEPLPAPAERLYRIALAMTEVASAIEIFDQPDVPYRGRHHHIRAAWTQEA